jgi:membrane associated rhomboid family serine protease
MFFFPFHINLPLGRLPVLTILIVVACIAIFLQQLHNSRNIEQTLHEFCSQQDRDFNIVFSKLRSRDLRTCEELMYDIHISERPEDRINQYARVARPISGFSRAFQFDFVRSTLQSAYADLQSRMPSDLTDKLAYHPETYNPLTMLSSQFVHGDWGHLIGNMIFFFAFAASIEVVLGSLIFIGVFLVLSVIVSLAYSVSVIGDATIVPTVGLSGVITGMLGLFAYLMPRAGIRCLLVILLYIRVIILPAWMLAIWYIGWDLFQLLFSTNQTGINLVAHVSGAAAGYVLGMLFFRAKKKQIRLYLDHGILT